MNEPTIKSVTNCPTYGAECTIEGDVTHCYVPKNKYTDEEVQKLIADWGLYLLLAHDDDTVTAEEWFEKHKK